MTNSASTPVSPGKGHSRSCSESAIALLVVCAAVICAHFLSFRSFGLYEDDYWSIAHNYDISWKGLMDQLRHSFTQWPTGRPLNHFLPSAFAYAGARLGGVDALYCMAAWWLSFNCWLVFLLVRRWFSFIPSIAAALAYVLFPADTTRQLLIHVSHVQGAMSFLFIALLFWLRGGALRWFSYPVASLCLMSYETAFLPFLAAPLLDLAESQRMRWRTWLQHLVALLIVLGAIAIVRMNLGDSRAAEAMGNPTESLWRAISSLLIGPATGLRAYANAIMVGMRNMHASILLQAGLIMLPIILCWSRQRKSERPEEKPVLSLGLWLAGAAALTWAGSYALTLVNYPPNQIVGRMTSTHVAAAWPVALLCGCLVNTFLTMKCGLRRLSLVTLALAFVLLLSYANHIQAEYVKSWRIQKDFWFQVLRLAPDMDNNCSVIAAGTTSPIPTPVIRANSWADFHACRHLYGMTPTGASPNFGHLGVVGQLLALRKTADGFEWKPQFWSKNVRRLDPKTLILFRSDLGVLTRVASIETQAGRLESTRPIPKPQPDAAPRTRLFKQLLQR